MGPDGLPGDVQLLCDIEETRSLSEELNDLFFPCSQCPVAQGDQVFSNGVQEHFPIEVSFRIGHGFQMAAPGALDPIYDD